ncbi:hypothetical protein Q7P35_002690 [Cladosporium inversicolor]
MPFPSLTKSKPSPKPTDTRPLLYAQSQSPSTPSLAPSSTSTSNDTTQPTNNASNSNDQTDTSKHDPPPLDPPLHPTPVHKPPPLVLLPKPPSPPPRLPLSGCDPVVKAEMDLARLGRVYGEHHHRKGVWKRGTSMMGQFGNIARGGSF